MARVRTSRSLAFLSACSRSGFKGSLPGVSPASFTLSGHSDHETGQSTSRSLPQLLPVPAHLGPSRGFASTGSGGSNPSQRSRAADAAAVLKVVLNTCSTCNRPTLVFYALQNLKIGKLHEQLRLTSESVPYIHKEKLLKMVQDRFAQLLQFWHQVLI